MDHEEPYYVSSRRHNVKKLLEWYFKSVSLPSRRAHRKSTSHHHQRVKKCERWGQQIAKRLLPFKMLYIFFFVKIITSEQLITIQMWRLFAENKLKWKCSKDFFARVIHIGECSRARASVITISGFSLLLKYMWACKILSTGLTNFSIN